jgi:hypothetical protein
MIITVYKLLVEHEGEFVPALNEQGEQMTFEAIDTAEAGEYLAAMQAENGKCFSAEKVSEYGVPENADAPDGQQ